MKKNIILFLVLILSLVLTYFFIYKKDTLTSNAESTDNVDIEKIKGIYLTSGFAEVQLELRDSTWWILKPNEYLANQELIEKALMSMLNLKPIETFELKEDRFGFDMPQGFIEFVYKDEQRARFIVGSVPSVGQNLYVLNKDNNQVLVYHNIWGQFFYYPEKEFFHKNLPIIGTHVKKIQFFQNEKLSWSIESHGPKDIRLLMGDSSHIIEKAQLLWFFNRLREFNLKNLVISSNVSIKDVTAKMIIETEKGNITFEFREKENKILIPSLNVFAEYETFSLSSLTDELKKVIKSDKK